VEICAEGCLYFVEVNSTARAPAISKSLYSGFPLHFCGKAGNLPAVYPGLSLDPSWFDNARTISLYTFSTRMKIEGIDRFVPSLPFYGASGHNHSYSQ
jgi:hypothetical protein